MQIATRSSMPLALPTIPSFPLPATAAPIPPAPDPGPTLLSFQAKMKLDEAITTADHAQERLNLFLDAVPLPTADQLNALSQAIWRLTAVRKTIYLIAIGKYSYKGAVPFPKGLKKNIRILEEAVKLLGPLPRPAFSASARRNASVPCGSSAPRLSASLPSLGGGAPRLRLRRRGPQKPIPASESGSLTDTDSALHTPPSALECQAPACPELRAPLSTAQAAAHQADQLCREAGLPTPKAPIATYETPSTTPKNSTTAPKTLAVEPESPASVHAPALKYGPSRGRRELPLAKRNCSEQRSAAGGKRSLILRPSAGARSCTPCHTHDPPISPDFSRYSPIIWHFSPPAPRGRWPSPLYIPLVKFRRALKFCCPSGLPACSVV
jgi:hypothetical protein